MINTQKAVKFNPGSPRARRKRAKSSAHAANAIRMPSKNSYIQQTEHQIHPSDEHAEQACRNNTSIPHVDHTCRTISKQHVERPRKNKHVQSPTSSGKHVVLTHLKKQHVGHICLTPNIETKRTEMPNKPERRPPSQAAPSFTCDALLHERRAFTSDALLHERRPPSRATHLHEPQMPNKQNIGHRCRTNKTLATDAEQTKCQPQMPNKQNIGHICRTNKTSATDAEQTKRRPPMPSKQRRNNTSATDAEQTTSTKRRPPMRNKTVS